MFRQKNLVITSCLLISFILVSCKPQYELLISEKEAYFAINPETILDNISQGEVNDIFVNISSSVPNDEEKTIYWTSANYFQVVWLLNEQVNSEFMGIWQLRRVYLDYDCVNPDLGFNRGIFFFYRIIQSGDQQYREILTVDITPGFGVIRRYEASYSPVVENWKAIDLQDIQVTAEQVVQIAQNNGGDNALALVDRKCFANADLLEDGSGYHGWDVSYRISNERSSIETIFEAFIDPEDGSFQVVVPCQTSDRTQYNLLIENMRKWIDIHQCTVQVQVYELT